MLWKQFLKLFSEVGKICFEGRIKDKRERRWFIVLVVKLYLIVNKINKIIVFLIVIFVEGYRGVLLLLLDLWVFWCRGREFVFIFFIVLVLCSLKDRFFFMLMQIFFLLQFLFGLYLLFELYWFSFFLLILFIDDEIIDGEYCFCEEMFVNKVFKILLQVFIN